MSKVNAVPKGYSAVTVYVAVKNVDKLITFVQKAFGAKVLEKYDFDTGKTMHAEVDIGGTRIMMGDPCDRPQMTAMLHLYVADCDAVYKKAVKAGATVIRKPADQFYGDRSGAVRDKAGNVWLISTRLKPVKKSPAKKSKK